MAEIELLFSTGDATIDRVMRGYIAAFAAAFENHILERYREFMLDELAAAAADGPTVSAVGDWLRADLAAVLTAALPHSEDPLRRRP